MLFLVPALAVGMALGYAQGGRLRRFADVPPSLFLVLWLAIGLQLTLAHVPESVGSLPARFLLVVGSYLLAGAWLWRSAARLREALLGIYLMAIGWFLNLLVISANGGMPVSRGAVIRAGLEWTDVRSGSLFKHVPAASDTPLRFLGDVIAVPPVHRVVSIGDIVLLVGIALFVSQIMSSGRIRPPARAAAARR
jgi:Family of unknown function (DUF5317)